MAQYLVQHRFVVNPIIITGEEVKESMELYMWAFHNSVNHKIGKPILPKEERIALYELKSRAERSAEAATLLAEITEMFAPYMRRQPAAFTLWQRQSRFLLSLLASGSLL
jgi:hypothetical protein